MEPRPPLLLPHRVYGRCSREHLIANHVARRLMERVTGDFFDLEDLFVAYRVETRSAIVAVIVNRRDRRDEAISRPSASAWR